MKHRASILLPITIATLFAPRINQAQPRPPSTPPSAASASRAPASTKLQSFKFEQADLDTVMTMYCEWTGKTYLKTDSIKAVITLKADRLTLEESIHVVDAILAMNNIALVPMGDKYIKVIQATQPDLTGQGLTINMDPNQEYAGSDKFVTQIIQLKHVEIPEVQAAIQHIMHAYGKIMVLERSNSLMLTDTESNINRARELINFIDQPSATIEPRIYKIIHADATEIATKINEIVSAAQGGKPATVPSRTLRKTPPGVIRPGTRRPTTAPVQATIESTESGNSEIIRGMVKVMSDERTNLIIIFSQEDNFLFFDKIIKVLDVEIDPAVIFEVVNLEYADATELASTLNELVGSSTGSRAGSRSTKTSKSTSSKASSSRTSRSSNNSRNTPFASAENKLSRLSEETKILADERTNSILLMGEKSDLIALKNMLKNLDVMLEQVIIEAAIFEVTLGEDLQHGIEWLFNKGSDGIGAWDGLNLAGPSNALNTVASGALTYYQNLSGINTEIAINLAATDTNVRLLSTPVIMTMDNTEAHLSVGEQRPVVTSTSSYANSSGTQSSNYEYKDIGIQLTVTPRINPQRVVVMEVLQQADQVGDDITIDGNNVPVILNREFEAQIAVPDRGTVALGGLVNTETRESLSKIPILGDIPLIGRYLFSSVSEEERQTELIVLLTPYVLTNNKELLQETERRYDSIDMQPSDWPQKGWSESTLRNREKTENSPEA